MCDVGGVCGVVMMLWCCCFDESNLNIQHDAACRYAGLNSRKYKILSLMLPHERDEAR